MVEEFRKLDQDKDGYIKETELINLLKNLNFLIEEDLIKIFLNGGKQKDYIHIQEFKLIYDSLFDFKPDISMINLLIKGVGINENLMLNEEQFKNFYNIIFKYFLKNQIEKKNYLEIFNIFKNENNLILYHDILLEIFKINIKKNENPFNIKNNKSQSCLLY